MNKRTFPLLILLFIVSAVSGQNKNTWTAATSKNDIAPVGIIKDLSDSVLLDVVPRPAFRYFWHYGHPVSGLGAERDFALII